MNATATITEANRDEWLKQRRSSIGASDAPAVLGVSPWATPIDVWQRKLGIGPEQPESEAMLWGKLLEPLILDQYQQRTGRAILATQEFVKHPAIEYMTATLDARTDDRLVEVKTASAFSREWGDEETDEIPESYLVQVHHQLAVTGFERADVAVLVGGQRLRIYEVRRSDALIDAIVSGESVFWDHVVRRTPPDYGRLDARALAILNPECAGEIDLTSEIEREVVSHEVTKAKIKALEELAEEHRDKILAAMGNAQTGILPDGRIVKRYLQHNPEVTKTVTYKESTKHYFKVLKGSK